MGIFARIQKNERLAAKGFTIPGPCDAPDCMDTETTLIFWRVRMGNGAKQFAVTEQFDLALDETPDTRFSFECAKHLLREGYLEAHVNQDSMVGWTRWNWATFKPTDKFYAES